jgi:hypothetical protein
MAGEQNADQVVEYSFAPVNDAAGKPIEVAPEAVKPIVEFAQKHKLSKEAAQDFYTREVTRPKAEAPKVPEKYTFAKVKNGDKEVDVDPALVTEVSGLAKELGLSEAQAQKIMDREVRLQTEANTTATKNLDAVRAKWKDEVKRDEKIGGANLEANLGTSKKALQKFFPAIAKDADKHAFLDFPDVVRGLVEIGKLIGEDGDFITGERKPSGEKTAAQTFYSSMAR